MKKNLLKPALIAVIVCLSASITFAQDQMFKKDDLDVSVGLGFGSPWISSGYSTILPPSRVSAEYGLRDDWGPGVFGVGGFVGATAYKYRYSMYGYEYGYNYFTVMIAARAAYHYTFVDKLDTYAGSHLGFKITSSKDKSDNTYYDLSDPEDSFVPVLDFFAGAKYYFSDTFAAYAEVGSGIAYFNMGISLKFKM